MTKHTNTPELRFPGFRDEWKATKLGSILEDTNIKENHDAPLYSLTVENGITEKTERYNREFLVKKNNNFKIVKPFNIVYNPMNITLGAIDLLSMDKEIKVSGYYNVLRIINQTNPFFLINLLKTYKSILLFKKVATGSLREKQRVHFSEFKNLKKYLPSYIEQEKIGSFFSKLDRQIELEEEKLELLEQQKHGYMQKIFSQELRVKDVNGNHYPQWTLKNFKEVFQVVPSKKYQIKSSEVEDNANIPVVDQGQNLILGYSNNKEKIFKDFKNVIIYGDHTTFVKKLDKPFIIGGDGVKLLTSKTDNDINYLYNVLQYFNVKPEGYKRHFSILKTKYLYIATSIEEQKRIATLFNKIDKLIENQSKKLDFLKQRKQGLLQKMFI